MARIGAIIQGAAQALPAGIDFGLNTRAKINELDAQRRKQEAAVRLEGRFKDAAAKGGFDKMDDAFFNDVAADVAGTGDLQGATAFAEFGRTVKARRTQDSASRAQTLLDVGDAKGAQSELNTVLNTLSPGTQVTGIAPQPDGSAAFTLSNGKTLSGQKASALVQKLSMSPPDYLEYMFKQIEVDRQERTAQATIAKSESDIAIDKAKLPGQLAEDRASAAASQAAALNSQSAAAARAKKTPFEVAKLQAETTGAQATAEKNRANANVAIATQDEKERLAAAQAEAAEFKAANPNDTRNNEANARINQGVKDYDERFGGDEFELDEIDPAGAVDPYSPFLRDAVRDLALQNQAQDRSKSGAQAAGEAEQQVRVLVDNVVALNPELAEDPTLAAEAVSTLLAYRQLETEQDETGTFVVLQVAGEERKIYLDSASGVEGAGGEEPGSLDPNAPAGVPPAGSSGTPGALNPMRGQ